MKRTILLFALILFALPTLYAQSTSCTKTTACFELNLLGATRFDDQRVKITYTAKVLCENKLDYIAFELPAGSKAATPSNIQQQNNDYIVRNGQTSNSGQIQIDTEFNAIQFNAKTTAAINKGEIDKYEFYLTNEDYNALAVNGMRVQAKTANGTVGLATFDLNTCAPVPAPTQTPPTSCTIDAGDAIFGLIDAVAQVNGTTVVRFLITNNAAADVTQIKIKAPSTPQAIAVVSDNNGSAYKAKYNYRVTIDQATDEITFDAQNTKGYANGASDVFIITLPTDTYTTEPLFNLSISAGAMVTGTGFNTKTCTDSPISPLPVELVSFEGMATQSGIELEWSTASETGNAGFEVEHSQDGTTFSKIGMVAGAGDSNAKLSYTYTDTNPLQGTNYYRLKQLDEDGAFEYSKLIAVSKTLSPATKILSVYPNPVSGNTLTLALRGSVAAEKATHVQIMNMNGNVVANHTLQAGARKLELSMPELNLPSGIYLVKLQHGKASETQKLIIP